MRAHRFRSLALLCVGLAACTGGGDPAAEPTDPARPPTARLIGENLELLPGDDLAMRIAFEAADDAAQVIVTTTPDTARVSVCPLTAIDAPLPPIERCRRDIASGVREPVTARGLSAVAIVLAGDAAVAADLRLEFAEAGRALTIAIPRLRAPARSSCDDNACNAFFEVVPVHGGPFRARATWQGPDATLVLLQGRILGRSSSATGLPYAEPARADGASPLRLRTSLTAPAEYAVVLRHRSQRALEDPLRDVLLEMEWPRLRSS